LSEEASCLQDLFDLVDQCVRRLWDGDSHFRRVTAMIVTKARNFALCCYSLSMDRLGPPYRPDIVQRLFDPPHLRVYVRLNSLAIGRQERKIGETNQPSGGRMRSQHRLSSSSCVPARQTLARGLVAATVLTSYLAVHAQGPDINFVGRPQFAANSCRSYALVLALGTLPNSPFPISTAQELRNAERDLQARLESTSKKMTPPSTASSHEVWKRAVEEMTSGQVDVVIEYVPSVEQYYSRVEDLTGVRNAEKFSALFSSIVVKTPVLTSVTKIGDDTYNPSHIISVYGVSSAPNGVPKARSLAVLNPAVKVRDAQKISCDIDDVPNDERWSAVVSLEPRYSLTRFPGGYLVMWLRKK
jgi:hypothetical protein